MSVKEKERRNEDKRGRLRKRAGTLNDKKRKKICGGKGVQGQMGGKPGPKGRTTQEGGEMEDKGGT